MNKYEELEIAKTRILELRNLPDRMVPVEDVLKILDDEFGVWPMNRPENGSVLPYDWTCACGLQHKPAIKHCFGCGADRPNISNAIPRGSMNRENTKGEH